MGSISSYEDQAARFHRLRLPLPSRCLIRTGNSYEFCKRLIIRTKRLIASFGDRLLKDINPAMVEAYKQERKCAISFRGKPTKPATVNRELTTFKTIFNKAVRNGKAEKNPAHGVKPFKENNVRDRILSPEEYVRLLAHCSDHVRPVVRLGYFTAM